MTWNDIVDIASNFIDPVSSWIGVFLAIPVIWTWWQVTFGVERQKRRWFKEIRTQPGHRPVILIIDFLTAKNIESAVENFRQKSEMLRAIPDDRIFRINRSNRLVPEDMPEIASDLRTRAADIFNAGADVVHCFYAGPCSPVALIGAEFANACRVLIYQYHQGEYQCWGPLKFNAV